MLEFSIASITAFVGCLNELVKEISKRYFQKDINKWIPLFSIAFGLILGVVGYFIPHVEMGNNVIEAIFIGISAGCAATGIHQVSKQLSPDKDKIEVEYVNDVVEEYYDDNNNVEEHPVEETKDDTGTNEEVDESNEDYAEDE